MFFHGQPDKVIADSIAGIGWEGGDLENAIIEFLMNRFTQISDLCVATSF